MQGVQPHSKSFDLVKIRGKSEEISAKYVYCVNLRKIAVHALILQKWHPKYYFFFLEIIYSFWKSCIQLFSGK